MACEMYAVSGETLTGIANAIRSKTGSGDFMTVASMASAIEGITGSDEMGFEIVTIQTSVTRISEIIDMNFEPNALYLKVSWSKFENYDAICFITNSEANPTYAARYQTDNITGVPVSYITALRAGDKLAVFKNCI